MSDDDATEKEVRKLGAFDEIRVRVRCLVILELLAASTFWVWALVNAIREKGMDGGLISFLIVLIAAVIGGVSTMDRELEHIKTARLLAKMYLIGSISSHIIVSGHFLFATISSGLNAAFGITCSVMWFLSGFLAGWFAHQWPQTFDS